MKCLLMSLVMLPTLGLAQSADLCSQVDIRMGLIGGSNCTVGPQLPHGSIAPGPDTPDGGHSGYRPDRPIRGFSQLHVSGTGWGQYGQMLLSPQVGLAAEETAHDSAKSDEIAEPHHYGVTLTRYGIRVDLAPTHDAAICRLEYPATDNATLVLDVTHSLGQHIVKQIGGVFLGGSVKITSLTPLTLEASGRYQGGFGSGPYAVHAVLRCDRDATSAGTWHNAAPAPGELSAAGDGTLGAFARFDARENRVVQVRMGISLKSIGNAGKLLEAQIPAADLGVVQKAAAQVWNERLGRIRVEGLSEADRRLFYTCVYHSQLMPRERTGDNPKGDSNEPYWDDHYAVWDTWRTAMPLLMLVDREAMRGIVRSFIDRHEHGGRVADAFVAGVESGDQGGNDPDNIIADAYVKGLDGVDWKRAWGVLKAHAEKGRTPEYRKQGWIVAGRMSCSNTLEMAYNDACAAQVARGIGEKAAGNALRERSRQWQNLWRADLTDGVYRGFVVPKRADGTWVEPFDPRKVYGSWLDYFYEGSSWNYGFFVPQDIPDLVEKCGGKEMFAERLEFACAKGLVEQWNEPAFLSLRLFAWAGRPDLTSRWVRKTMGQWGLKRGYPGNDDSGAMSSWYVFSALGFFPVAGQDLYIINGPLFPQAEISLGEGRKLTITATNAGPESVYVQSATLNGQPLERAWFRHAEIASGGELTFVMGPNPSEWGKAQLPPGMP
jgi:predicted alpha-1,2-mannosidase